MAAHERSRRTMAIKALAKLMQRSERTVRRYWAEARADYQSKGAARQRPWEAAGISRATWYRRRRAKTKAMQKLE